jgi:hypothetical protein
MSSQLRFDGHIIDLRTNPQACAELRRLYDTRKRGDKLPLFCVKPHQGQMHLRLIDGQLWAAHNPNQGGPGCSVRIPRPEGPDHHHCKDYVERAADNAGFTAQQEHTIGHGIARLDVAITAPQPFGAEPQFSAITAKDAKAKTTKAARHGWPRLWLPGTKKIGDTLAGAVPVLRHNDTEIDWIASVPAKGTVTALGLRRITAEQCTPASRWKACPDTGRGIYCRQWHPWLNDLVTGWTLDDAITGFGEGELTILQTRQNQVQLVIAAGLPLYQNLTGHDGMFSPGADRRAAPPPQELIGVECTADRPILTAPAELLTIPEIEDVPFRLPPIEWSICQKCGRDICHPDSIADGLCRGCSLKLDAVLRRRGIA